MKPFAGETWVDRSKQLLSQSQEHVYKETEDGIELKAYIFSPEDEEEEEQLRTAVVFFSSGSWDNILISQFAPQALHFVERGAVAILIEYRVSSTHGTSPMEAVSDARSALRWVRYNSEILNIDPTRIVAAGGSGGAHLALAAAMIPGCADDQHDPNITCVPNGLVLYCPVVDTSKKGFGAEKFLSLDDANKANPSKYIGKHLPPMIIFHGTQDRIVSFDSVARFAKQVTRKSNVCQMIAFDGKDNTFYNFNVSAEGYDLTLFEADRFLVEQGFLPPRADEDVEYFDYAQRR